MVLVFAVVAEFFDQVFDPDTVDFFMGQLVIGMSEENIPGTTLEETDFVFDVNGRAMLDNLGFVFQSPALRGSGFARQYTQRFSCVNGLWAPCRRFSLRL
jgi:hypothetical protein